MTDEPKLMPDADVKKEITALATEFADDFIKHVGTSDLRAALITCNQGIGERLYAVTAERDALRAQLEALFSHAGLWRIATMLESCARVSPYGDVEIRTEEVHDALAAARDAVKS